MMESASPPRRKRLCLSELQSGKRAPGECIVCGCCHTPPYRKRPCNGYTLYYRECRYCGHRFVTRESGP